MSTTVAPIRPTRVHGADPLPRGTCLGQTDPTCTADRHGTYSAYHRGCRCPHARDADRIYKKRLRERRAAPRCGLDGTGTRRRLQALAALGWRWPDLGQHLGTSGANVGFLARSDRVMATTVARVNALYRRLSTTPGPSTLTRHRAVAKGWVPPIAWDDDTIDNPAAQPFQSADPTTVIDQVAVDRALRGRRVALTATERVAAVATGLERGMSRTAIATALHTSVRQVRRIQQDLP